MTNALANAHRMSSDGTPHVDGAAGGIVGYCRDNPTFVVFCLLALGVRLVFWAYTGRTWEDALITLTPARNAWEGFGLTHHVTEPRVHSFTSPISVLIPLAGEAFRQGLFALKFVSLLAAIPTIYFAYRISRALSLSRAAEVLFLGFLAFDQLHIMFGMAGMETQVAVAAALANAHYLLTRQWWKLGLATGFGMLCRPEFAFWIPVVGLAVLLIDWRRIFAVALGTLAVAAPWFVFATLYYGSPIPNTIVAKSHSWRIGFGHQGLQASIDYVWSSWKHFAPFWEMTFTAQAPLPEAWLKVVVIVSVVLLLVGVLFAVVSPQRIPLLAVAAFVGIFLFYRAATVVSPYYMWYLPPFTALMALLVAFGVSRLSDWIPVLPNAVAITLAAAYAIHIPFSFNLEREWQAVIEDGVRARAGVELNKLMGPTDTVVLEPLGYIGWEARNKTTHDYPGLSSPASVAAIRRSPPPGTLEGLVDALKPDYVVLRPFEQALLEKRFPETAALYAEVTRVGIPPPPLTWGGYRWLTDDAEFRIFRRKN